MNSPEPHIDAELLRRYDKPGPRYTSYPTAVEFHDGFGATDYLERLERLDRDEPVSLYLHLPFCRKRCAFCGCHVVSTPRTEVAHGYLDYIAREMELLTDALGFAPRVGQMHWGGGTPTYFTPDELVELNGAVRKHFDLETDAEVAIEVDPRVTTRGHLETLRSAGFNRVSLGVQDVTPEVQDATGRHQDVESTRQLFRWSRDLGFDSVNIDLVYGLPAQTLERFEATLAEILSLRPDRLAIYGYAHLPSARPNQRKIDAGLLPSREVKFELFARALRAFGGAGYRLIGMDHFARPDDEMSLALEAGNLHRNFMGYTVRHTGQMIGLGISSIGEVGDAFVQNEKKLSTYYRELDAGRLPVHKGFALDDDDKIRREAILQLMCNLRLRLADLERQFDIDAAAYFADELAELRGEPTDDGFVEVTDERITVTPLGQRFLRNICMIFDRYLRSGRGPATAFSRTI